MDMGMGITHTNKTSKHAKTCSSSGRLIWMSCWVRVLMFTFLIDSLTIVRALLNGCTSQCTWCVPLRRIFYVNSVASSSLNAMLIFTPNKARKPESNEHRSANSATLGFFFFFLFQSRFDLLLSAINRCKLRNVGLRANRLPTWNYRLYPLHTHRTTIIPIQKSRSVRRRHYWCR